jgi:MoaA/NifB/PqqE/SkfB family radical SAM enzyme
MYKVDIKLGYSCNNNCIHCVIQDFREVCLNKGLPEDLSTERFKFEMEDSRSRGAQLVVFTGGEPTVRSDLVELLEYAKTLGLQVLIQTNGRNFCNLELAQQTARVGNVINYCIALHAPDAQTHDAITRAKGSFAQTVQGITNLINLGQNVSGKIVISKKNYQLIPATTQLMIDLGIRYVSFTFPHGCGNARRYFLEVVPRYEEIITYVKQGLNLCLKKGVGADTETFPYCFMEGYERFATELLLTQD